MKSFFILNGVQKEIARELKDTNNLTLRQLDTGDAPLLAAFYENLSADSRVFFTPHKFDIPSLEKTVADFVKSGRHEAFLLTDCSGNIKAYFFLWNIDFPTPVLGIAVADAWQNKGVGGKLVRFLLEEARVQDRAAVELTVHPDNARAFHLYQKIGFKFSGMVERIMPNGKQVQQKEMFFRF